MEIQRLLQGAHSNLVAQIFNILNLLYRRIAFGRAPKPATTRDYPTAADCKSAVQQNTILRYFAAATTTFCRAFAVSLIRLLSKAPEYGALQTLRDFRRVIYASRPGNPSTPLLNRSNQRLRRNPSRWRIRWSRKSASKTSSLLAWRSCAGAWKKGIAFRFSLSPPF